MMLVQIAGMALCAVGVLLAARTAPVISAGGRPGRTAAQQQDPA